MRLLTRRRLAGSGARAAGGTLYFTADDGGSGVELWRSDGTGAGTRLVKDINPGEGDSSPDSLIAYSRPGPTRE